MHNNHLFIGAESHMAFGIDFLQQKISSLFSSGPTQAEKAKADLFDAMGKQSEAQGQLDALLKKTGGWQVHKSQDPAINLLRAEIAKRQTGPANRRGEQAARNRDDVDEVR